MLLIFLDLLRYLEVLTSSFSLVYKNADSVTSVVLSSKLQTVSRFYCISDSQQKFQLCGQISLYLLEQCHLSILGHLTPHLLRPIFCLLQHRRPSQQRRQMLWAHLYSLPFHPLFRSQNQVEAQQEQPQRWVEALRNLKNCLPRENKWAFVCK